MARRRFREALDMLNEAIRADPWFAESYQNRAAVFEALGMTPQAEADRRKVADLGGVKPPLPDEAADEPQPKPVKARQRPAQLAIRYPTPAKRPGGGGGGAAMKAAGTILITIGLFIAAGIGIYIALSTISDAVNGDSGGNALDVTPTAVPSARETPAPSGSATPVRTPTPVPEPVDAALVGSPLSFSDARSAWEAKGLTVAVGNPSTEVTGFATTAVDVTLSKGGASMSVAVLFYDSAGELATDWTVSDVVVPKTGTTPAGPSPWADHNAIVVMLADDPTIHADARDAFLGIP
jgi:hypothetical protein